jgi:hypothetical protein
VFGTHQKDRSRWSCLSNGVQPVTSIGVVELQRRKAWRWRVLVVGPDWTPIDSAFHSH